MEKLLTVTVPCYNSAAYMRKCIDSLLTAQDHLEIIIVDDGSHDETGAIADTYQEKYPDTIRVIHQENGGHGEGINQGIANASGKYFKVVDSDDWVNEAALFEVLAFLETHDVDLLVTNYVYEHEDGETRNTTIHYGNVFPKGRVITWEDTHRFLTSQYLTLHSAIFRTEVIRECGIVLPKHTFYEDNLFIYAPLPYVKKLAYINADFYRYLIGREGQSVAKEALIKRADQQVRISKAVFAAHDIYAIKKQSPKLARYLFHEVELMMIIGTMFTRLNKTEEAERQNREMWEYCDSVNPRLSQRMRFRSKAFFINLPGHFGRIVCYGLYRLAHSVVKFN